MKYYIEATKQKRNSLGVPQITIYYNIENDIKKIACNVFGATIPEVEERAEMILRVLNMPE